MTAGGRLLQQSSWTRQYLAEAPKTRVFEANICLHYYEQHDPSKIGPDGSVDEELCKGDAIQKKMAMIFGWQELFDAVPGVLLAMPFGALADKRGRKWVFAASLMGLQFNSAWILLICACLLVSASPVTERWLTGAGYFGSLPLQLTWVSSAFYLIGGGPIVAVAIGITMVSDISPPDKRTTIFLYLAASTLVAEMIAPLLAARLMEHGDWLPLLLALAIQQVGITIAAFLPETLHLRDLPEPRDSAEQPDIELRSVDGPDLDAGRHGFTLAAQLRHFKDAVHLVRRDRTIGLVIFTFLANRLGRQSLSLLIRYASKRYKWKISEAAYLLSFRAATNLVALTVFVPIINLILLKIVRLPAHWADLWLSRGSIVLVTVSFFIMGIAAHPALLILGLLVYNLGTGYGPAMRSIAIHVVGGQASSDIGRLFAVIAIVESAGAMIAGPLLAGIFEKGIALGEPWIGIPFLASGTMFVVITIVSFLITFQADEVVAYAPLGDEEPGLLGDSHIDRSHQD